MINDLQDTGKDTSKSCVFDFPDRPVDTLPPNYPPSDPLPPGYPYDPVDDWPEIPHDPPVPGDDPIPGIDPHPMPGIPPINPNASFNEILAYYVKGEDSDPPFGSGEGPFNGGATVWNISLSLVAHIAVANKFSPRDTAGPFLLSETGHSTEEAAFGNSIQNDSGIFVYTVDLPGTTRLQYICYYARYFNSITGDHFIAFAPCGISRSNPATIGTTVALANFQIGPAKLLLTIGVPPAQTLVTKTFLTACIYLADDTISHPDEVTIP